MRRAGTMLQSRRPNANRARPLAGLALGVFALLAIGGTAWAQPAVEPLPAETGDLPPLPVPNPRFSDAPIPETIFTGDEGAIDPFGFLSEELIAAPDLGPPIAATGIQDFRLNATLSAGGATIPEGVRWRVFGAEPQPDGRLPLIADEAGGAVNLRLDAGLYYLHAAFGYAGATAVLRVTPDNRAQTIDLEAGGLRLKAMVGEDVPLAADEVSFEVYGQDDSGLGIRPLIVGAAPPDEIIRLNAGSYEVVSYYGETNAVVRADVDVEAGQLTDLTLFHQGARVTLKLVSVRGGDSLANTAWAVVSPAGETVFDSVGAFPSLILAAGDYTAIARHDDKIYEGAFTVRAAEDRDVEVMATDPVEQPPVP